MKPSTREGLSSKRIRRKWQAVKTALEDIHLIHFVLHFPDTEVLALFLVTVASPWAWVGVVVLAAWIWRRLWRAQSLVRMNGHKTKKRHPAARKHSPRNRAITAPDVPRPLADLAREGIGVKITIELKPLPGWPSHSSKPSHT